MAIFKKGDMWERWGKVDLFCVATCSTLEEDNILIMNEGFAKSATVRLPGINQKLGQMIASSYADNFLELPIVLYQKQAIGAFQVKHNPDDTASRSLIKRSICLLFQYLVAHPSQKVCLDLPKHTLHGTALRAIVLLPDNVEIWERE